MLKPYTLPGILTRSHVNGFNEKKEKKGKVNTEIDKYEKRKKNTKKPQRKHKLTWSRCTSALFRFPSSSTIAPRRPSSMRRADWHIILKAPCFAICKNSSVFVDLQKGEGRGGNGNKVKSQLKPLRCQYLIGQARSVTDHWHSVSVRENAPKLDSISGRTRRISKFVGSLPMLNCATLCT